MQGKEEKGRVKHYLTKRIKWKRKLGKKKKQKRRRGVNERKKKRWRENNSEREQGRQIEKDTQWFSVDIISNSCPFECGNKKKILL